MQLAPAPTLPIAHPELRIPGLPGPTTPGVGIGRLVAPPAPDSVAGRADLAAVKAAQRVRTPAGNEWAQRMDSDGIIKIWRDLARRHRADAGVVQGWLGTALLAATMASNLAVTQFAKRKFERPRPFEADPSITPVVRRPHDKSYPSGHASSAYAAARIIATLEPKLAVEAYDLASQVAISRVYGGVHYPSDVIAGALLGTAVAESIIRKLPKRRSAGS